MPFWLPFCSFFTGHSPPGSASTQILLPCKWHKFFVSSIPDIFSIRPPGNQFSLDNAFLAPILQLFLLDTLHLGVLPPKSCPCKWHKFFVSSIPDIFSIRPPGNQFSLDNAFLAPILQLFLLDTLYLSSAPVDKPLPYLQVVSFAQVPCAVVSQQQPLMHHPVVKFSLVVDSRLS